MRTLDYAPSNRSARGATTLNLLACITGGTVLLLPVVIFAVAYLVRGVLANPIGGTDFSPVIRTVMLGYNPLLWGLSLLGVSLSTASLAASKHVSLLAFSGLLLSGAALASQILLLLV